jgi:hypothetical protein
MLSRYLRPLKLTSPDRRVSAKIFRQGDQVRIEVDFLEEVRKDDPPFAHNGVIVMSTSVEMYPKIIEALTKYLDDLFLKGMADEDTYSSLGAKSRPKRVEKRNLEGEVRFAKRTGSTPSVHSSPRRTEQTESPGRGDADSEVAKSSDSPDRGKDQSGN